MRQDVSSAFCLRRAMLALGLVASALLPSPTLPMLTPVARPLAASSVQLNLAEERIESVKACGIAGLMGTLASAPVRASELLASNAFAKAGTLAEWQFTTGVFAVELALFGVVYRCIVRDDDNDMLKQGAVGAAALCRALSSSHWVASMPASKMWLELAVYFGEGVLAFGCAAAALEFAWDRGIAYRLGGIGLPPTYGFFDNFYDEPLSMNRNPVRRLPPPSSPDLFPRNNYRGEAPRYYRSGPSQTYMDRSSVGGMTRRSVSAPGGMMRGRSARERMLRSTERFRLTR